MNSDVIALRRELHAHPELSGVEFETSKRIQNFIKKHHSGEIVNNIGGCSFAVIYNFGSKGKTVAIRCELDALPINEVNTFKYVSTYKNTSHKCGHDGHMSIVSGLIFWLKEQSFNTGKVILLFQSAEETGKGAYEMLQSPIFKALNIDYIFALHNIPEVDLHTIITMNDGFSAEVESLIISLQGIESHAAEPEKGINPSMAIAKITNQLNTLIVSDPLNKDFAILTPVHIKMGSSSYGVSPAKAELHYTIRTWSTNSMNRLKENIIEIVNTISTNHKLFHQLKWLEHFPASNNTPSCNSIIKNAAKKLKLNIHERSYPFKFGEDFGWFTKEYKTGMFGLGSGINTPPLHNPSYDFPDEIIPTGIQIFGGIIQSILSQKTN